MEYTDYMLNYFVINTDERYLTENQQAFDAPNLGKVKEEVKIPYVIS